MLKFDKDVIGALKTLEKAGFETYAAGDCVIEFVSGGSPVDWDLLTAAPLEKIRELFPEGEEIERDGQIVRLDFTYEETDEDGITELLGAICDVIPMKGNIEEELAAHGFTALAVADNPERGLIDPYNGVEDIRKKILRTIGNADELLAAEPVRMMQAMRYVSEQGFDLSKDLYEAIIRNWRKLLDMPPAPIRNELELIMVGEHTGKALNMMADTGLMAVVLGEEVARKMTSNEMQQFVELSENIDKTQRNRLRRLGLLYCVLTEKRGIAAVERMNFDADTEAHLKWALTEMIKITFLVNDVDLKRYIFENGSEKYNYLHNLAKAQRIVFDQPTIKIETRNAIMKQIRQNKEPIFLEDLVIDANDIIEAGITDDPERAEELLRLVIAKVHLNPVNNDRSVLLKQAKKMNKSKFRSNARYVKWIR